MDKTKTSITQEEYLWHCEDYNGLCLACFEFSDGNVEPDAENYKCESCGEHKVMGCELALISGHIGISSDD